MPRLKSFYQPWPLETTPLGRLGGAGVLVGGRGTGFERLRVLENHALVLLIAGAGRYRDRLGRDLPVAAGDCLVVTAGCAHQYGCEPGGLWEETYVTFGGAAFDGWFPGGREERPVRSLGDGSLWLPRWLRLVQTRPATRGEAVALLAEIHLLLNALNQPPPPADPSAARLEETRRLIETWPSQASPDWEQLARACHLSYETWRKAFAARFGEPPARYRRRHLMEQAAALLRRTRVGNEALAEQFGCVDAAHFSKLFKAVHGVAPSAYRAR